MSYGELARDLKRWLAAHGEVLASYNPPGLRYKCVEELVLEHATLKPARITDCAFPEMRAGNCFANAFELCLEDPTLRYFEGWANMEQSFPTHHAWVEDAQGNIHDPTWLTIINGYKARDDVRWAPGWDARCVYAGVHIPMTQHLGWMVKQSTMNLLSYGEMTHPEVLQMGLDAFQHYEIAEAGVPRFKEICRRALSTSNPWELSEDGYCYERTNDDGSISRWRNGEFI